MKNLSLGIAALSAAFALTVSAQNSSPTRTDVPANPSATASGKSTASSPSMQFGTVDQNKDGRISRAEAVSHGSELGGAFATLDADSDAYLSSTEFGKWNHVNKSPEGNASHSDRGGHSAPADGKKPQPATGGGNSATRTPATGQ